MATLAQTGMRQKTTGLSIKNIMRIITLHKSRRALANLDENTLADIGVTRESALVEANRPIWDVPSNWRK